jgi:hypothetical protein
MPVGMKFRETRSSQVPACSVSALMPNFVIAKSIWEGKLSMRKFDTSRAMFKPDGIVKIAILRTHEAILMRKRLREGMQG